MDTVKEDNELWIALKEGNRQSFSLLYSKYSSILLTYGLRIINDEDIVRDGLQDTFIKLWVNRETIGIPRQVKFFLLSAFRNNLLTLISKDKKFESLDTQPESLFKMDFTLESEYIKKEDISIRSEKLSQALNQLSPRQKEIIYLRYFEELNYDEISEIMNITVKGAYKLSARGLQSLQSILNVSKEGLMALFVLFRCTPF